MKFPTTVPVADFSTILPVDSDISVGASAGLCPTSLAKRLRDTQAIVLNSPPTIISYPSITIVCTFASASAENVVSNVPSALRRARRSLATHPTVVKYHPMSIFPSGWIVTARPEPLRFGLNVLSKRPVAVTRAIRFLAVELTDVNSHTRTIPPSDCMSIS